MNKVLSYACNMGFGPTPLARYHKHCKSKVCECPCHSKILKEIRDIKAEHPDLYEALAKDDPSLIGKKKKK